jgi:primosomal protein N' (replication factor Y)
VQPRNCPACGEPDISAIGAGTEKLEELLQQQFAPYPVHRIDSDNMTRRDAMSQLRQTVLGGEPCILAGTQMISKGHHFPGISLVVVQDADQALFSADYRATEKMAQQLVQVAGRCGRGELRGRILLQTHQPDHPLLQALIKHGYHTVAADLLSQRQAMQLPPWQHQVVIRADAPDMNLVMSFMRQAAALARQLPTVQQRQVQLLGPIPALLERKAARYRYQLWLQSEQRGLLHSCLSQLIKQLEAIRAPRNLRWRPDVDPLEM